MSGTEEKKKTGKYHSKVMGKLNNIITGWSNYLKGKNLSPEIIEMAERRAAICVGCPNFQHSEVYAVIDKITAVFNLGAKLTKTDVTSKTCKLCGCQFPAKLETPDEHCPDNPPRWSAEKI